MGEGRIAIGSSTLGPEEADAARRVILSGALVQGSEVESLEAELAQIVGTRFCIAVASGSAALELAVRAQEPGPGDEIITSPFSFFATASSIIRGGAVPVLADVEEDTFNLNPDAVADAITHRTIAIMPVHLYGRPCNMDPIVALAERYGLALIEDACQALGASYAGRSVGSYGLGCFSFYGSKNVTCGEGGAITLSDAALHKKLRILRNHGSTGPYTHAFVSTNYRLTDVQAAILRVQLTRLAWVTSERQRIAGQYNAELGSEVILKPVPNDWRYQSCYHLYTIKSPSSRLELQRRLDEAEIECRVYYPLPIHHQAAWNGPEYSLPVAEECARGVLSIPVHPNLQDRDVLRVISVLNRS